jgi:hypothetical protein
MIRDTFDALVLLELDQPVEEVLPVLVAGHVVVGDEERRDALLVVLADDRLEIVGVRKRLLRPCTLMMVQNEHWNGQPRPRSKLDLRPSLRASAAGGRLGVGAPSMPGRSSM